MGIIAQNLLSMAFSVGFRLTGNKDIKWYEKRDERADLAALLSERHLRCRGVFIFGLEMIGMHDLTLDLGGSEVVGKASSYLA
jgi:hypothetical protein